MYNQSPIHQSPRKEYQELGQVPFHQQRGPNIQPDLENDVYNFREDYEPVYGRPRPFEMAENSFAGFYETLDLEIGASSSSGAYPEVQEEVQNPAVQYPNNPQKVQKVIPSDILHLVLSNHTQIFTENLGKRINYELRLHGIHQKTFADLVCGRSQGTISQLIKAPKPWEMVNTAGREPYIQMLKWVKLCEPDRMAVINGMPLQCCSWEAPEKKGTKRSANPEIAGETSEAKRYRIVFTNHQKQVFQEYLEKNSNLIPDSNAIQALADELGLQASRVRDYFQNFKKRQRKQALRKRQEQTTK